MTVSNKIIVYIDESGTLPDRYDKVVVVAAVGTGILEKMDTLLKRAKKRCSLRKPTSELKFYTAGDKTKTAFFETIAKQDFIICTLTVDKMGRKIPDTPLHYAALCILLIHDILSISPDIGTLIFDRHFSRDKDIAVFNTAIRQNVHNSVIVKHVDSLRDPRVNIADMVAGAVLAKETGKDKRFYEMIEQKIASSKRINWIEAKKRMLTIKNLREPV